MACIEIFFRAIAERKLQKKIYQKLIYAEQRSFEFGQIFAPDSETD